MIKGTFKHVKGTPYPQEFKDLILAEYYRGVPRGAIAMKYNLDDPTIISHWVRNFEGSKPKGSLPKITYRMPNKKSNLTDNEQLLEREIRRLKNELSHKEQALHIERRRAEKAELKNDLLNMIVDIAEDELKINIRKKSGPKQ